MELREPPLLFLTSYSCSSSINKCRGDILKNINLKGCQKVAFYFLHVLIQPKYKFLVQFNFSWATSSFLCLWSLGLITSLGFLFEMTRAELRAKFTVCFSQVCRESPPGSIWWSNLYFHLTRFSYSSSLVQCYTFQTNLNSSLF